MPWTKTVATTTRTWMGSRPCWPACSCGHRPPCSGVWLWCVCVGGGGMSRCVLLMCDPLVQRRLLRKARCLALPNRPRRFMYSLPFISRLSSMLFEHGYLRADVCGPCFMVSCPAAGRTCLLVARPPSRACGSKSTSFGTASCCMCTKLWRCALLCPVHACDSPGVLFLSHLLLSSLRRGTLSLAYMVTPVYFPV
jgi:hypothetical protein